MPVTGDVLTWDAARAGSFADPKAYWAAGSAGTAQTILAPVGLYAADEILYGLAGASFKTVEVSEEARAIYMGRAGRAFTGAKVVVDVQTAAAGCDWVEAALFSSSTTPTLCDGPTTLTRIVAVDASGDWNAPGPVATDFGAITIAAGTHLWFVYAAKKGGGTLPAFRGMLPDGILSGVFIYASGVRPTTMAATAFNRTGSTVRAAQCVVGCS